MNKLVSLSMLAAAFVLLVAGVTPALADNRMAVQPDGRIVLGGLAKWGGAALVRYLPDGALDPGFGKGGIAVDRRLGSYSAISLQADGRILTGSPRGGRLDPSIGRYLADGSADPAFGTDGLTVEPAADGVGGSPSTVVAEPNGRILVATNISGTKYAPAGPAAVSAFAPSGTFERTLLEISRNPFATPVTINDLLPASGAAAGSAPLDIGSASEAKQLLFRLQEGTPSGYDPGFGGGQGLVLGPDGGAQALTADQAGNLLTAGASGSPYLASTHGVLTRSDAGGMPDPAFGNGGRADLVVANFDTLSLEALALTPNGSIVAVGGARVSNSPGAHCGGCQVAVVARFTPGGQLDPSFGSGGVVTLGEETFSDRRLPSMSAADVAVLADGSVLVAGAAATAAAPFVLARLTAQGSLDPAFGKGGVVVTYTCKGNPREPAQHGCAVQPRVSFRVGGLRTRRPSLQLKVRPDPNWARIESVQLILPRPLRIHPGRIAADGGLRYRTTTWRKKPELGDRTIDFDDLGNSFGGVRWLALSLWKGAFSASKPLGPKRTLTFRVRVGIEADGVQRAQTVVFHRRP